MNQVWRRLKGFNCGKFNMLKDGENIREKGSVHVLGKHKPKMTYSTNFYKSHTLQAL